MPFVNRLVETNAHKFFSGCTGSFCLILGFDYLFSPCLQKVFKGRGNIWNIFHNQGKLNEQFWALGRQYIPITPYVCMSEPGNRIAAQKKADVLTCAKLKFLTRSLSLQLLPGGAP